MKSPTGCGRDGKPALSWKPRKRIMEQQKRNHKTNDEIAETKTVYLTQSAPVMIASIMHLLDRAYSLRKQKEYRESLKVLQKVRRILFNGIPVFGPNFPGVFFRGTFYSALHNIDSIIYLCYEIDDGSVLDLTISNSVMEMIKELSSLAKSWYEFVQEGSPEPGCRDPNLENDEVLKKRHKSYEQFQVYKSSPDNIKD